MSAPAIKKAKFYVMDDRASAAAAVAAAAFGGAEAVASAAGGGRAQSRGTTQRCFEVQFNPETLKVSYSNRVVTPKGGARPAANVSQQYVGEGETKLSVQLWFDVSADASGEVDVLQRTAEIVDLIKPKSVSRASAREKGRYVPPRVRFQWGSFAFEGIVESVEQSLELFSPEGHPLRASVSLSMVRQEILEVRFSDGADGAPGTRALTPAPQGVPLQRLAAAVGAPQDWVKIAEANDIENPRLLVLGQRIDLDTSGGR